MSKLESIIQDKKECFKTQCTFNLHKHHIFGASNRNKSERYGLFIYLRSDYHNLSNYGIHFDKEFDLSRFRAEIRDRYIKEFLIKVNS